MFSTSKTHHPKSNGAGPAAPPADNVTALNRPNGQVRHSNISQGLEIIGDLKSDGDITLEGKVEGNIRCRALTLNGTPVIKGDVVAETVRVCGTFGGKIEAGKVHLTKTARMTGEIAYRTLAIETGASFEGKLSRLTPKS